MAFDSASIDAATRHLKRRDPVMRSVIGTVGPFTLRPHRDRFGMLVRSIIAQQISGGAARSIQRRLWDLFAPRKVSAQTLAALSLAQLRSVGISPQKTAYLHDLAAKVASGQVRLSRVGR